MQPVYIIVVIHHAGSQPGENPPDNPDKHAEYIKNRIYHQRGRNLRPHQLRHRIYPHNFEGLDLFRDLHTTDLRGDITTDLSG